MTRRYLRGADPAVYAPIRAAPVLGLAATLASTGAMKVAPSGPEDSFLSWLYATAAPCW